MCLQRFAYKKKLSLGWSLRRDAVVLGALRIWSKLEVESEQPPQHRRPRPGDPLQLHLQALGATMAWEGGYSCLQCCYMLCALWIKPVFSVTSSSANLLRPVCVVQGGQKQEAGVEWSVLSGPSVALVTSHVGQLLGLVSVLVDLSQCPDEACPFVGLGYADLLWRDNSVQIKEQPPSVWTQMFQTRGAGTSEDI